MYRMMQSYFIVIFLVLGAVSLTSCETAKRFAPPGFVKYEDLEKGIPVNPSIQKRIDEIAVADDAGYPNLSQTPQEVPEGMSEEQRKRVGDRLELNRDIVQEQITVARKQVETEFGLAAEASAQTDLENGDQSLEEAVLQLQASLEAARAEVEKEQKQPLPRPLDISSAPEQEDPF